MTSDFRSLKKAGYPEYEIDVAGNVRRKGTKRLLKYREVITHKLYYQGVGYQLRIPSDDPTKYKFTLRLRRNLVAIVWGPKLHSDERVISVDFTDHLESLVGVSDGEIAKHCRSTDYSIYIFHHKFFIVNANGKIEITSARPLASRKKAAWTELYRRASPFIHVNRAKLGACKLKT